MQYDLAVIGGGAAGLMTAITYAREMRRQKKRVSAVLLEGNAKVGKKLLATGNGRCNLTNTGADIAHYHGDTAALASVLEKTDVAKVLQQFEDLGLICVEETEGRVYPASKQAMTVVELLKTACNEGGVVTQTDSSVTTVKREAGEFLIKMENGKPIRARQIVLATGGLAASKHSCLTNGYELAKSLGHTTTHCRPALTKLRISDKLPEKLAGVRCGAEVTLRLENRVLGERQGEVQFTKEGVSGICVMDLSSLAGEVENGASPVLQLNFLPDRTAEWLIHYLRNFCRRYPQLDSGSLLTGLLHVKLGRELVRRCNIDPKASLHTLRDPQLKQVADTVRCLRLPVIGTADFAGAQVTAGGVPLAEVDTRDFSSRVCPGLYLCGELLNINGDCGGFNLHFAWLTGLAAGRSAARNV